MKSSGGKRGLLLALCLVGVLLFSALGIWQVERRAWKLDLIARVNARVQAPPEPLPSPQAWSGLDGREAEYRHVQTTGTFDHDKETRVDALTERGAGVWVVTPLRTGKGIVLVNRGFVPRNELSAISRPRGEVALGGLLRLTEPGGRFLRPNRPEQERWYSRDVAAIARARGLDGVAPFFIDAAAATDSVGYPLGGLTVIRFRNTHLIYALTWFGLAGLCVAGLVLLRKSAQTEG